MRSNISCVIRQFRATSEPCLKTFSPTDDDEDEVDTSTEPTLIVDGKDDLGGDGEDEQDPWTITEAPQTSDRYGECMMPVTPALDPDLSPQSGMRFGKTGVSGFDSEMLLI